MDLFRREWFVDIDGDGDFDAVDYIILDEILSDDDGVDVQGRGCLWIWVAALSVAGLGAAYL